MAMVVMVMHVLDGVQHHETLSIADGYANRNVFPSRGRGFEEGSGSATAVSDCGRPHSCQWSGATMIP